MLEWSSGRLLGRMSTWARMIWVERACVVCEIGRVDCFRDVNVSVTHRTRKLCLILLFYYICRIRYCRFYLLLLLFFFAVERQTSMLSIDKTESISVYVSVLYVVPVRVLSVCLSNVTCCLRQSALHLPIEVIWCPCHLPRELDTRSWLFSYILM